jgi:hypothetical protein
MHHGNELDLDLEAIEAERKVVAGYSGQNLFLESGALNRQARVPTLCGVLGEDRAEWDQMAQRPHARNHLQTFGPI